jgi:hypothetical protein
MLTIGMQRRSASEVFGQLVRIVASLIFSRIWVPIGNTGGTDVKPTVSMPIPDHLKEFFADEG